MKADEAKYLLSFHSGRNEDIENDLWEKGFVSLLRPFRGIENLEQSFHELMKILFVLSGLLEEKQIEKELVADIFCIIHLGKMWGYSNVNIFSNEEVRQIECFVDHISYTAFCLLDGAGVDVGFEMYQHDFPDRLEI